jgi:hypothetical protein
VAWLRSLLGCRRLPFRKLERLCSWRPRAVCADALESSQSYGLVTCKMWTWVRSQLRCSRSLDCGRESARAVQTLNQGASSHRRCNMKSCPVV